LFGDFIATAGNANSTYDKRRFEADYRLSVLA
jgi:hypothetical protein